MKANTAIGSAKAWNFDQGGKGFTSTRFFPRRLVIVLLSKTSGELIDTREFDAGNPYLPMDLTIEEAEQKVGNQRRLNSRARFRKSKRRLQSPLSHSPIGKAEGFLSELRTMDRSSVV